MKITFVLEDSARGVKLSTAIEHSGTNDGVERSVAFGAGLSIERHLRMIERAGGIYVVDHVSAIPLLPAPRR